MFQTPLLTLPFDVQVKEFKGKAGCVLPLSLKDEEFKHWLLEVNEHLKGLAVDNSLAWYGKELSLESMDDEIFTDMVKQKNPKYPASYAPKLPIDGNHQIDVPVFDGNKELLIEPFRSLSRGSRCATIINITHMFLGKGIMRVSVNNEVSSVFCISAAKKPGFAFDVTTDKNMVAVCEAADGEYMKRKRVDEEGRETTPSEDTS